MSAEAARPARPRRSLAETISAGAETTREHETERLWPAQEVEAAALESAPAKVSRLAVVAARANAKTKSSAETEQSGTLNPPRRDAASRSFPTGAMGERGMAARRTVLGPKPIDMPSAATGLPAAGAGKRGTEPVSTSVANSAPGRTGSMQKDGAAATPLKQAASQEARASRWRGNAVKVWLPLALAMAAIWGGYLYLTTAQDATVRRHAAGDGVRTDAPKSRIPRVSIDDLVEAEETATGAGGRGHDVTVGAKPSMAKTAPVKGRQGSVSERVRSLPASPAGRVEASRMSETLLPPRVEVLRTAAAVGSPGALTSAEPELGASSAGRGEVSSASAASAAGDVPVTAASRPAAVPVTRMSISSVALASSLISARQPIYPADARRLGMEGKVVLEAVVGRDGVVQNVRVLEGPVLFQQSAIEAVRTWRYRPYLVDGQPVEVETRITVSYKR